ncbi:hypothetical protein OS493_038290 [Desmophyllum pertusum]|uniref:Uncharacterized protein n=1 Tax=Desmophyllum pertusum TaxID=174260 RepID=A0A9X0D048_9CNID|nr:hypothetical protein OS493_038290 [Desmophyllum pertusum]
MGTKFKSARVGKSSNLTEQIETEDLKDFWRKRQFNQFLKRFKDILSSPPLTEDDEQLDLYTQAEFVVRFMIVDKDVTLPIEKMLIEYFSPVWNRETRVGFSFGNANSETNPWNKFHIQGDEDTIIGMLEKLRIR